MVKFWAERQGARERKPVERTHQKAVPEIHLRLNSTYCERRHLAAAAWMLVLLINDKQPQKMPWWLYE
jgi:hypothetical protein